MAPTAVLFPGQGSHTPEMHESVASIRPDLLSLAATVVGTDPFPLAEEGTMYAQPAIFCASLAGWNAMGSPEGDFMAGHSLGELGALVAAGCLTERDGLELVALRGRLMQEAGERAGDGGMLALLGAGAAERAESWRTPTAWPSPMTIRRSRSSSRGRARRCRARRPPRASSACGRWSCRSPAPSTRR